MKLNELTIEEAGAGLRNGDFTAVQLTKACLERIDERNATINAFITVTKDLALRQAKEADARLKAGTAHPLTGIPFSVKDAICVEGVRSTGSATILDQYISPYQSSVVTNVLDTGAVLVGKTNCDAFGHGASNENSMYGPVLNPHDTSKVAGGSSGGSAASVADNMCLFSIAEDTGGSIRQPAAFCGIVGLRPSYGRNSRHGIMPMASSFDTVGPMAKTVTGAALVQQVMAGQDTYDATTVDDEVATADLSEDIDYKELRVGIPKEYFEAEGMDPETEKVVRDRLEELKERGAQIVDVSLPHTKYAIPVYYVAVPSEDSSNLGRLDGIRYGSQVEAPTLKSMYSASRSNGFPEEVKRRIMIGTYALSAGYYDAYYKKAQKVRTLIRRDFDTVFETVDVLIAPTSPFPPFALGEKKNDVLAMYLADIFVSPASVAGVPAISIPAGETASGLPIGMQLIAKRMQEMRLMDIAHNIML